METAGKATVIEISKSVLQQYEYESQYEYEYEYELTLTWMPWIKFLSGRTCILLWILYGNMVDFSFIVSLYVSDLPNVTISTSPRQVTPYQARG